MPELKFQMCKSRSQLSKPPVSKLLFSTFLKETSASRLFIEGKAATVDYTSASFPYNIARNSSLSVSAKHFFFLFLILEEQNSPLFKMSSIKRVAPSLSG